LIAEGAYPFHWGGVSTWCDLLLRHLPQVEFTLLSIIGDPRIESLFELPENVKEFRPVALWGIREALEAENELSLANILRRKRRTREKVVASEFVPLLHSFLRGLLTDDSEPENLGRLIHQMHRFFLAYDFDATFRSQATWDCFVQAAQAYFPHLAAQHGYPDAELDLAGLTQGLQWLNHWFFPIAKPLPPVDVAHAAMAGICTMVAVSAKLEHGAAFLLTEHGIYLRESYLAEASSFGSLFLKLLRLRFARRMTEISYALADQISPVCDHNRRWELKYGARPDQLKTIYNGVDSTVYTPTDKPVGEPPVVVWVGRISPLKDLDTLIRSAALVHQARPDIQFRLFGSAAPEDEPYYKKMLALRTELGLDNVVTFCGYAAKSETAFNQGDVVVLSSISEAFPFSNLESMLCAKPVVATAVGGVREQIEGCGVAVEPRNPQQMAQAILALMNDPEARAALGRAARETAVQKFSVHQLSRAYYSSYLRLSNRHEIATAAPNSFDPGNGHQPPRADATDSGNGHRLRLADLPGSGNGHRLPLTVPNAITLPCHAMVMEMAQSVTVSSGPSNGTSHPGVAEQVAAATSHSPDSGNGHRLPLIIPNIIAQASHAAVMDLAQPVAVSSGPGNGATQLGIAEQVAVGIPHSLASNNRYRLMPTVSVNLGSRPGPVLIVQRKPDTASSNRRTGLQTLNAGGVAALADDVSRRIPQPVDSFEITALLESLGITDEVATQRYGAPDTFSLAEAVLTQIRVFRVPAGAKNREPEPPQPAYQAWRDYALGPLALVPVLVLLLIVEAYRVLGNWNESHILALSLGMTSSMLILNGFIQAISRRSSIYLGLNNPSAATRFLRASVTAAGICNAMIAVLAVLVATGLGVFTPDDRIIFGLAFVGFSALWLMAAGLLLMQATSWLGIGLAAGLVAGVMTDRAIAPLLSAHLALATVVGFGVAMGLTLHATVKHGLDAKAGGQPDRVKLPPAAYMIYEAAPYFAYGSLYMVFILIPHLLGWFGVLGMGQERGWALSSVEVGLVLSLPPIILCSGIAEHALRQFWLRARAAQPITPGSDPRRFGFVLTELYRRQLERYLIVLAGTSAMAYVVFQLALSSGLLASWLRLSSLDATRFFFYISLIVYGLLGWGQFNGAFCVTLARPTLALRAVMLGMGIVVVTGVPLSLGLNFTYAAIAFIAGAITFVAVSSWNVKKVLESADYYYFSSS
jgi:glycosyltransferase involved in cell wall biosynthesis